MFGLLPVKTGGGGVAGGWGVEEVIDTLAHVLSIPYNYASVYSVALFEASPWKGCIACEV